ncbi:MAG: hypothetical protein IAE91_14065 [Ignavibacteriaceae bacterium]|nr:hypothetical protein [Ignavibacteriaceae bacterium]
MQLFEPSHYAAFDQPKPKLDDLATRFERTKVKEVFLELHSMIWPHISSMNWDLHRHRQVNHYVSSDHFVFLEDGTPIVNYIDGMWLHYGKSPSQLDFIKLIGGFDYKKRNDEDYFNAFYLHTRIQFYINDSIFRAWLLLATDKNYYDRSELLRRLSKDRAERTQFFYLVKPLFNKDFFYEIDDRTLPLTSALTEDAFIKFVRSDTPGIYSGIVKEYDPMNMQLEVSNIKTEMVENLNLLYPLYNFMSWRPKLKP